MGAGCAGGEPEVASTYGQAFDYQFGIVTDSLDDAINDTQFDNIDPYQGYASFAVQGLPTIIQFTAADGHTELSAELQTLHDDVDAAIDAATTLTELKTTVQPFVDEMRAIQAR